MKTFIQILLLTSSSAIVLSHRYDINDYGEPGIPIRLNYTNFAMPSDCKNHVGGICNADCRTLMVCAGQATPIYQESCEKIDSTKPFCIDSACVSTQGSNNDCALSSSFLCTTNGIFPDPTDCTKYYMCPGSLQKAESYQCDESKKLVFSIDRKLCVRKTSNAQCQTINCEKNPNKFIPYAKNPGYYAFCGPTIIMYKCLDDENQIFDSIGNKCVFNCKQAGYFIDRTSCEDYFICERIGGKWTAIKESCPKDYKFDGNGCVFAPNCKPAITQMPIITTEEPTTTTEKTT